jgi:D-sedoheptulose 7-phosphate isomerase
MINSPKDIVERHFARHESTVAAMRGNLEQIVAFADEIIQALRSGNKVLLCGNGGSAADAQHFAAELVGRYETDRRGLPAIALTTDSSVLTSLGNDFGFEHMFSRQVSALGSSGDVLVGISTSGTSANVLNAAKAALSQDMRVLAMTSTHSTPLAKLSHRAIFSDSDDTALTQEMHIFAVHCVCAIVDEHFS